MLIDIEGFMQGEKRITFIIIIFSSTFVNENYFPVGLVRTLARLRGKFMFALKREMCVIDDFIFFFGW